ncbi:PIN domain protein [Candidatus Halobeggiatoa sp. HSG11]|nr:PIN domain protein [Candidatus Halobeggiatoa sp. HSG11]
MLIYLDICCFNRPYDTQSSEIIKLETEAKLAIQHAVLQKQIRLVWSFILDFENNANPYPDHREAIAEWKNIASIQISALETIRKYANQLTAIGIKSKDALHVASSVEAQCDYFITTDKRLLKKSKILTTINTVNPVDFILKEIL